MSIFIIGGIGIAGILLGKTIFGKWFNHVGLYFGVWTFSLCLYETKLIRYYEIGSMTWIVIAAGAASFFFGACTVAAARWAIPNDRDRLVPETIQYDVSSEEGASHLDRVLWFLIVVSLATVIQHWFIVTHRFGSVLNVLILGNYLYTNRVHEGLSGSVPYLDAFALTACMLAGVNTAVSGKLKASAIFAMLTVILADVSAMGRAKMILAAILFACGYLFTRQQRRRRIAKSPKAKIRQAFALLLAFSLLVGGLEFVRSARIVNEKFKGATPELNKLNESLFITPSIYLYFSVHPVVLDKYLSADNEHLPLGGYTFAQFYRILAKLGLDVNIPIYAPVYTTPIGANTGTYLREVHADFGNAGLLLYPYFLGMLTSFFWFRYALMRRYTDLSMLAHIFVIVFMSFILAVSGWGYWLVSLIVGYLVGRYLDTRTPIPSA